MAFETTSIGGSPTAINGGNEYGFSGVRVVDANTGDEYYAGDNSGRTFVYRTEVNATQNWADWLYQHSAWKTFCAYEAPRAALDPAAELGDMVIDGTGKLHGNLYTQETNFASGFSDIGAPGYEETDGDSSYLTDYDKALMNANRYTDAALGGDVGLQVRIVDTLPRDHASQNVLWVVRGTLNL